MTHPASRRFSAALGKTQSSKQATSSAAEGPKVRDYPPQELDSKFWFRDALASPKARPWWPPPDWAVSGGSLDELASKLCIKRAGRSTRPLAKATAAIAAQRRCQHFQCFSCAEGRRRGRADHGRSTGPALSRSRARKSGLRSDECGSGARHPRLPDRQAHPGGLIGKFQMCLVRSTASSACAC